MRVTTIYCSHTYKIIVAEYQAGMLLSVKGVPLIMMLGHPSSEGKLRQVVTLPADPCLFHLPVLFLVSPFLARYIQTLLDAHGLAQHS